MPSPPGFPIKKAELMALLIESIVFGIFLTFFLILVTICCAKHKIRLANRRFVLIVATVMMAMSIVHLVISFVRVIRVFATSKATENREPNRSLMKLSDPIRDSKVLIYGVQTLLGDAVLVWRCYIVYNRSLYAIIPTGAALLGNLVFAIIMFVSLFTSPPGVSSFRKGAWQIIIMVFFAAVTMCLNLCCTIAIVVKLWRTHQLVSSNYGRSLFPVIAVIIESGALYTAGVASLLISLLARSSGQAIPRDMLPPLVGVVFCLIVLQIHFQMRVLNASSTGTASHSLTRWGVRDRVLPYELQGGVDIYITQHATTDQEESDTTPEPKPQCVDVS